jgi:D-alanine-D-alanine ligase
MKKIRVLVLAGGQSDEHEVSIRSARSIVDALPKDRFEVQTTVISREGRWLDATESTTALSLGYAKTGGGSALTKASVVEQFDVVFPVLHGPHGEDGTMQGMLKLAGIPCVGSDVLGSAVCMDKVMMKSVLCAYGLPQVAYQLVTLASFADSTQAVLDAVQRLGFPLFVKPANLGSSVGISKVKDATQLVAALRLAFRFDRRVIVEAATRARPRELEIGILGNDSLLASPVGELSFDSEFYDYETKYTAGMARMHIPAQLPERIAARARQMALAAFRALDCAGLARVDFFYVEDGEELLINELNTMPGFTTTSMYPKLMEAAGIAYPELVTRMIELAMERHRAHKTGTYS